MRLLKSSLLAVTIKLVKNLCSFVCKRSLPKFFQNAMAQMSQKSPCSLVMSFQNQSSPTSIYTSSPEHSEKDTPGHLEKDTTVIASLPTRWPVRVTHERSGKKGLRLTKRSRCRSHVQMLHPAPTSGIGHGFPCRETEFESRQKLAAGLTTPV